MVHRLEAAVRRNGMEHLTRRCYSVQQKGSLDEPSQQGTDSRDCDRRDPQVPAAYADHPRMNPTDTRSYSRRRIAWPRPEATRCPGVTATIGRHAPS